MGLKFSILDVQQRVDILLELFYDGRVENLLADINMSRQDFKKIFTDANMFYTFQVRLSVTKGVSQNWLMLGQPPILLKNIFNYSIVYKNFANKIVNLGKAENFFLL